MAYINTRAAKNASRKPAGLTVAKATADARKLVNRVMPSNLGATFNSRLGHDLDTDTPTVITTITFPRNTEDAASIGAALLRLADGGMRIADSSVVITRKA